MWNELVLIRIPFSSRFGEAGVIHFSLDCLVTLLCVGLRYRYSVLFQQEYNLLLSWPFSLFYITYYWTLDIEPLILTLDIDLDIDLDIEPLILNPCYWTLTWTLDHDLTTCTWYWTLTLDPSVFYPGATCCGVATTIALMHQCYVL